VPGLLQKRPWALQMGGRHKGDREKKGRERDGESQRYKESQAWWACL
jgi:hypothetical protein